MPDAAGADLEVHAKSLLRILNKVKLTKQQLTMDSLRGSSVKLGTTEKIIMAPAQG